MEMQTQVTEEAVAALTECVYRHPRHREVYYQLLAFCADERAVDEAESFVEGLPAFADALQRAGVLVDVMVQHGGLAYVEYDGDGRVIDDARIAEVRAAVADQWEGAADTRAFEDAVEDALFDLVARRTVRATPAARAVVQLLDPERRVAAYATGRPEREPVYRELLSFCLVPRSLDEIKALLDGNPALAPTARTAHQPLHASYFIDRLHESGGLEWQNGWVATPAGRAFLEAAA